MTKKRRSSQAVSEVVGVILLLGITIGLFGFLNYVVFSYSFQPSAPSVNLVGSIENGYIIIEHNGGEPLDGKTQIRLITETSTAEFIAIDHLSNINNNHDDKWNFGETVQLDYNGVRTQVIVVDPTTNTLILSAVLS